MRNLDNIVSDIQEDISTNHFPIKAHIRDTQNGWTTVRFESVENNNVLEIEVHVEDQNTCVLHMIGFTYDQRDLIMNTFVRKMFD